MFFPLVVAIENKKKAKNTQKVVAPE